MRWARILAGVLLLFALGLKPLLNWAMASTRTPVDPQIGHLEKLSPTELSAAFNHKRVLVVGGTRGIGRGIARAITEAGADVVLVGRNAKTGAEAVSYLQQKAKSPKQQIRYLAGDLGTMKNAKALVRSLETMAKSSEKFDYLVVTAAVFPDWGQLLNEDGIEKGHAIALVGRYTLYRNMALFLKEDGRVLNVLASGEKKATFERDLLTGQRNGTKLWEIVRNWSGGFELAQLGLLESGKFPQLTYVSTHPGIIATELTHGQSFGLALDLIVEYAGPLFISLVGMSEDECGDRQASILASSRLPKGLSYVDADMIGRTRSTELQALVPQHLPWLLSWLNERSEL